MRMARPPRNPNAAHFAWRPALRYTVFVRTRSANCGSWRTSDSSSSARMRCSCSDSGTDVVLLDCALLPLALHLHGEGPPRPSAPHRHGHRGHVRASAPSAPESTAPTWAWHLAPRNDQPGGRAERLRRRTRDHNPADATPRKPEMATTTISGADVVITQKWILTSWRLATANQTKRTTTTPVSAIRTSRRRS